MREEVLVEDLARELEQVHLALVVRLVLKETVEAALPLLVVQGGHDLADDGRDLARPGDGSRRPGGRRAERRNGQAVAAGVRKQPVVLEMSIDRWGEETQRELVRKCTGSSVGNKSQVQYR